MLRLFKISGTSLSPRFQEGDFVIVSKIPFLLARAKPGDVVAFHQPGYGILIKLVETVDTAQGQLRVTSTQPESVDSRVFGPVSTKAVVGKVIWHVKKPR